MSHEFRFLPPEILEAILVPSVSYQILNLWKCGDTKFNEKLCNIVTEVDLSHDKLLQSKYPRMLSKLRRLKSLTLKSPSALFEIPHDWLTELSLLPESLESLRIETDDSRHALVNHAPTWTDSKRSYIETDYGHPAKSRLIDISKVLPRLTSLELAHPRELFLAKFQRPPLRFDDLVFGLPHSITILTLPMMSIAESCPKLMGMLPKSLIELHAHVFIQAGHPFDTYSQEYHSEVRQDWLLAPPNLKVVKSLHMPAFFDPGLLPRSLEERCEWTLDIGRGEDKYIDRSVWPPNLRHLTLSVSEEVRSGSKHLYDLPWGSQLPESLTDLKINGLVSASILGKNILQLPRTLTKLEITSTIIDLSLLEPQLPDYGDESGFLQNFWPSSLTDLSLHLESFKPRFLPPKLTNLTAHFAKVSILSDSLEITVSELPPTLATLHINFSFSCKAVLSGTPHPSLRTFTVWRTDPSAGCLAAEAMTHLPSTLTSLKACPLVPLLVNTPWQLPSNLVRMEFVDWHCHWFGKLLPKTLTHIDIFRLSGLGIASNDTISNMFNDMPPNLKSFTISHPYTGEDKKNVSISVHAFEGLKELVHLDVSKRVGTFPSASLRVFSRELRTMKLQMAKIYPADAPFFPPLLRIIDINYDCIDWTMKDLELYWPLRDVGTGANGPPDFMEKRRVQQRKLYH